MGVLGVGGGGWGVGARVCLGGGFLMACWARSPAKGGRPRPAYSGAEAVGLGAAVKNTECGQRRGTPPREYGPESDTPSGHLQLIPE